MSENDDKSTDAIVAEAAGKTTVTVTWRDLSPFEVPMYRDDWSFEAVLAAERGLYASLAAGLLPPAAFAEFRAMRPTMTDARDLVDTISTTIGLADAGESPASAS